MSERLTQDAGASSRQDFERDVVLRARTDPEFKKALLADARTALQSTYGMEIPPDLEIQVLEETPSRFYLVLPAALDELTDEQLAAVAGGVGSPTIAAADLFTARNWASSVRMR